MHQTSARWQVERKNGDRQTPTEVRSRPKLCLWLLIERIEGDFSGLVGSQKIARSRPRALQDCSAEAK
jgi:hypothetical protein